MAEKKMPPLLDGEGEGEEMFLCQTSKVIQCDHANMRQIFEMLAFGTPRIFQIQTEPLHGQVTMETKMGTVMSGSCPPFSLTSAGQPPAVKPTAANRCGQAT